MKHYEVTIQTAKETIIEKFCFCTNIYDLTNNPMNQDERLRKVVALEKIDDAIKLLSSIDL